MPASSPPAAAPSPAAVLRGLRTAAAAAALALAALLAACDREAPAPGGGAAGDGARADTVLRLPLEHEGACPLACCRYGRWTAETPVPLQTFRADTAPVRTVLSPGTEFRARDGEVWVLTPGLAVLRSDADDPGTGDGAGPGGVDRPPRDSVLLLDPLGGGDWRVWDGREIRRAGPLAGPEEAPGSETEGRAGVEGRVLRPPDTRWWVRVRTDDDVRGWVRMDTVRVSGAAGCG